MKPSYSLFGIHNVQTRSSILTLAVATALGVQFSQAANTDHVVVSGGGNVSAAGTFSAGGVPGSAPGDMMTYNTAATAGLVTIDSNTTIGSIRNLNTGAFTIGSGAGTLVLDGTGYTPAAFGFGTTTAANQAYIENGTSSASGGAVTVNSAISMNTNLGIGSRRAGSGLITIGGAITNDSGSARTLSFYAAGGNITATGNIGASGSAIAISHNGNATATTTLSGNLGSSVTTVTSNSSVNGSLILSGANTYTGATTLTLGRITAQDSGTNNFIKALSTTQVNLNAGTLFLKANGSGSGQTIITGNGTTGNNVVVGGNATIDVNRVSANTGSTIQFNNLSIGANTLTMTSNNSYALRFAGTTNLTGNATFSSNGILTLAGAIGDGGNGLGFTKAGAGTLVLDGDNTFTGGVTVNAGTLQLGHAGALNSTAPNALTFGASSTGTVKLNGNNITISRLNSNVTAGTLNIQSGSATVGTDTLTLNNSTTDTYAGTLTNGSTRALALTKSGSGSLTLSGASTYTGATIVSGGTLFVNGSLGSGSAVSVGSGATVGGTGSIGGDTSIQAGGIHASGNTMGVGKFTGNLTYEDASIFSWDIDRTAAQTRGTGYDAVNVTLSLAGLDGVDGNSTTDAIFRIVIGDSDFSDSFWSANNHSWSDIFTGADGVTAKLDWSSIFGGGFEYYKSDGTQLSGPTTGSFTLSGNSLLWTPVPEPTYVGLAGVMLAFGLLRRQRV